MEYIVFPTTDITEDVTVKMSELNLSPRKSINGDKVIMKASNYQELFPDKLIVLISNDEDAVETISYPYELYSGDDLISLLNTVDWSEQELIESDNESEIQSTNDKL